MITDTLNSKIDKNTLELIEYLKNFDRSTFVPFFIFLLWADRLTGDTFLQLSSKVQQIIYLLNILNNSGGKSTNLDVQEVFSKLETIENLYKDKFWENSPIEYYDDSYKKSLVSSSTYLNYFFNSELIYVEQAICRIEDTFRNVDKQIMLFSGLTVSDFIQFYLESKAISQEKFDLCYHEFTTQNIDLSKDGLTCFSNEKDLFLPYSLPHKMVISKSEYKNIDSEKLEKLFDLFTSPLVELYNSYYCSSNQLHSKPFISISPNEYFLTFHPNLISAIYHFLIEGLNIHFKELGSRLRSNYLEDKTKKIFESFFKENNIELYNNYYLDSFNKEKDLLVIIKDMAFIVECKSNKYHEPHGNEESSFQKIRTNFKKSIQDAYRQINEVELLLHENRLITVFNNRQKKLNVINTNKIRRVFSIIITQERFGQIQCDLGLLLNKNEDSEYPMCISINDLESALITISRMKNPLGELTTYLHNRRKLHERLICFDELDLLGHFLMQRKEFIKICNSKDVFTTSSDVCQFFDDLYQNGFGFKNELNIENKVRISIKSLLNYELCRKLKIKPPQNIIEFKKANGITNETMRNFKGLMELSKNNFHAKMLFDQIHNKSLSYEEFDKIYSEFMEVTNR